MAEYTFDGFKLRNASGSKVGELEGSYVRAPNAALLGEVQGNNIRDSRGKKLLEFDGKNIKDDRGKKITTIDEIKKLIEGESGIELVAMWYFFIVIKPPR
ncbi:MAG: hypothetical protein JW969_00180 [Spirochaetales bacterium]|nr:hypothetical protein [Spirochaetales bacterium]